MMKAYKIIAALIIISSANYANAEVSWIANSSFEWDGTILNIDGSMPTGWDDANFPSFFVGNISSDWSPDGNYSLTIHTAAYEAFSKDQEGLLTQFVCLDDANEIIFDLKLETDHPAYAWDPQKRSAIVKIDDSIIWDSNSLGSGDIAGEYLDCVINVNQFEQFKDGQIHSLSFGISVNEYDSLPLTAYYARFDKITFDAHCGGGGYYPADFNFDCSVDVNDLKLLADHWLTEAEEPNKFDLYYDEFIDFQDYAIFAQNWMGDSWGGDGRYLDFDFNLDGIVNFLDYAELVKNWDTQGIDYNQLDDFIEEWLHKSWRYPTE